MSMIKVEDLTFCYPSSYDNIFENVSFQIDTDWKLGFVGRNGRGKTTFLDLLQGKYDYSGRIISAVRFDYFPYPVEDMTRQSYEVLEKICPAAEEWELIRELSYLDVDAEVLYRPFATLSNGERTKALLAALFLNEGHFLLIDEPTNHLDMKARETVSAYLNKKKGFILVSHDRRFLDGCVDHILAINRSDIEVRSGSFSAWFEDFEQRQESELEQNERLKKDIKRLEASARRAAGWSDSLESTKKGTRIAGLRPDKGHIGHKAEKLMKRAKTYEARQQQAIEQKSGLLRNIENADPLKLFPVRYHSETLVELKDVAVSYDGRQVCQPVSLAVRRGERVFLDGKNGSGKSSLLKLITGQPIEHTGDVRVGSQLVISYMPQDTSHLAGSLSDYAAQKGIDDTLFRSILHKLDFARVQFEKDISDYSEGQKKKVLIAASLCEKAHLYIWDEPLNFIDLYSRLQIERLIAEYEPTMILVEHDAAFRDSIATRVVPLT